MNFFPVRLRMVGKDAAKKVWPPCWSFAASVRRPGGLIAAPLDPLLASLCSRKTDGETGSREKNDYSE